MLDSWLWILVYTVVVLALAALAFLQQEALWGVPKKKEKEPWEAVGLGYDARQDIFFYEQDTWQRKYGYNRWYDEAAAPLGMILDCEPIYFFYQEQQWMIEFWKGQYGMAAGCEIGIYKAADSGEIQGKDLLYGPIEDSEMLPIKCVLYHQGKKLFVRKGTHWWMTGFRLGCFAEPKDLLAKICIFFPNSDMQRAFTDGLNRAGYTAEEYYIKGKQVCITFHQPKAPQPISRSLILEKAIQKANKGFCELYQKISIEGKAPQRLEQVAYQNPDLYRKIWTTGNRKERFVVLNKENGENDSHEH